jgi:hypothetical protein
MLLLIFLHLAWNWCIDSAKIILRCKYSCHGSLSWTLFVIRRMESRTKMTLTVRNCCHMLVQRSCWQIVYLLTHLRRSLCQRYRGGLIEESSYWLPWNRSLLAFYRTMNKLKHTYTWRFIKYDIGRFVEQWQCVHSEYNEETRWLTAYLSHWPFNVNVYRYWSNILSAIAMVYYQATHRTTKLSLYGDRTREREKDDGLPLNFQLTDHHDCK